MPHVYYKRFRMEVDLRSCPSSEPTLPAGCFWEPWRPEILDRHASAKYESFQGELDSLVFPCLGDPRGCSSLMREIVLKNRFLPETTWLLCRQTAGQVQDCGTIQGIVHPDGIGAIQNVGIIPAERRAGLGRSLVRKSLCGFAAAGVVRVYLDVTAKNWRAVELYRSLGFRLIQTSYREVEQPEPVASNPA